MTEQKTTKRRKSPFVGIKRRRIKDGYFHRRFNKQFGESLTYREYSDAIDEVVKMLSDSILDGTMYKLPKQMGYMFIRARKRSPHVKPKIAFGSTTKARKETGDPTIIIYTRNDIPALKLAWFTTGVKVTAKTYSVFRPSRKIKKRITQAALNNKSYIYLHDPKKNVNRQSNTGSPNGSGLPTDSV